MNQSSYRFTHSAARVVAAMLFATLAFAPGAVFAAKETGVDRVDGRIEKMHSRLKITNAQEDQWGKVAQVMRDNARDMETLTKARMDQAKTMTAVDDLKSYGEITDAHADGIKKLTPVFAVLYAAMSDDQKKTADDMFRHGDKKRMKGK
ncbi:MAG TPA: Spy/CpxP family protein refolding chaperone [Burkholderiales bacterium]|nr:Spy/CpxP family protein refolding chaperone [Burkholderiales bacterium]